MEGTRAEEPGRWTVGVEKGEEYGVPRRSLCSRGLETNWKVQVFGGTGKRLMLRFPGKTCSGQVQVGSQRAGESPTVGTTVWKSFEETQGVI